MPVCGFAYRVDHIKKPHVELVKFFVPTFKRSARQMNRQLSPETVELAMVIKLCAQRCCQDYGGGFVLCAVEDFCGPGFVVVFYKTQLVVLIFWIFAEYSPD